MLHVHTYASPPPPPPPSDFLHPAPVRVATGGIVGRGFRHGTMQAAFVILTVLVAFLTRRVEQGEVFDL
jgi:hypothetical protein